MKKSKRKQPPRKEDIIHALAAALEAAATANERGLPWTFNRLGFVISYSSAREDLMVDICNELVRSVATALEGAAKASSKVASGPGCGGQGKPTPRGPRASATKQEGPTGHG